MKSQNTTEQNLFSLFTELVKIDSPSGHEAQLGIYLQSWLQDNGFGYSEDKVGNIFATKSGIGKPLLFCAHMDTVNPGCGIQPVLEGGVFKSKGNTILGADNKAAVTAIMVGVEDYLKETKDPRPIEILFTVKEESGGGVEFFDVRKIKSANGIIFDMVQPIGGITIASPYIKNFHVTFTGKGAHASTPEKGRNALSPAAKFASNVKVGYLDNKETIVNIGKFDGGVGINTIPGSVAISGEVRSFDELLFKNKLIELETLAKQAVEGTKIKVKFSTDGYCAGYSHDPNSGLVKLVARIMKEKGHKVKKQKVRGVSDANPLKEGGVNVLTLGDGVFDAHTVNERISLKSIEQIYELVVAFLNKA